MKYLFVLPLFIFHLSSLGQANSDVIYVCPPCHSECDREEFHQAGNCPTCGMKLILKGDLVDTEEFYFTFDSIRYSAEIARPESHQAHGTIVIIPGHGKTDFVGGTHYYKLKQFFTGLGFATLTWDKKGCNKTEGTYDHNQSVESSAQEALTAIQEIRDRKVPGSGKIGLWGISRAGWICPLIINQDPSIAFWISVSGTDQFDTFRYMVETNLRLEGRSEEYVTSVMNEFDHYMKVVRNGGESYEQLVLSTEKLFNDPFYLSLGQQRLSKEEFESAQEYYKKSGALFDERTGLFIMVSDFEMKLREIKCPVLAIFGELDSQIDWRKTQALYRKTIGSNGKTKLETRVLPDCNHNIMHCRTGALSENLQEFKGEECADYYETMKAWLEKTAAK
jgi:uncharacterized protein